MKSIKLLSIVSALLFAVSCTTTHPVMVKNNKIEKTGTAKNSCMFTVDNYGPGVNWGQIISSGICFNNNKYGLVEACEDGDIKKIATVDLKTTKYVIFTKYELIVTGE